MLSLSIATGSYSYLIFLQKLISRLYSLVNHTAEQRNNNNKYGSTLQEETI